MYSSVLERKTILAISLITVLFCWSGKSSCHPPGKYICCSLNKKYYYDDLWLLISNETKLRPDGEDLTSYPLYNQQRSDGRIAVAQLQSKREDFKKGEGKRTRSDKHNALCLAVGFYDINNDAEWRKGSARNICRKLGGKVDTHQKKCRGENHQSLNWKAYSEDTF